MRGKTSSLHRLARASVALITRYDPAQPLAHQTQMHDVTAALMGLQLSELKVKGEQPKRGVGIQNILLYKDLRLSVYYLPAGEMMRLHDHPKMQVINFLLKGKMQAHLYTPVRNNIYHKQTQILNDKAVKFIDGLRNQEGNLHQFRAIEPTYFLDIIWPDYDHQRLCNYYQEESQVHTEPSHRSLRLLKDYQVQFFQL